MTGDAVDPVVDPLADLVAVQSSLTTLVHVIGLLQPGELDREDVPPLVLRAVDTGWAAATLRTSTLVTAHGPAAGLLAWLIGRSDGDGLQHDRALPALPPWF